MSQLLIQHYLNELQTLRRVSGTSRESVVREAFKTLLKDWGRSRDLIFIPEYEYQTPQKTRVYPDGALLYALRVPLGYPSSPSNFVSSLRFGSFLKSVRALALSFSRSSLNF